MDVVLFSHDAIYSAAAVAAGIDGVVVDWEFSGKPERQSGQDTEINRGTVEDLVAARKGADGKLICRVNNTIEGRDAECKLAIETGASEIWLPMVRSVDEIEQCLRNINGKARLGVLVETREAMQLGRELERLPLARVYVGLHDYRIDCGGKGLFDPLIDGTLDRFRSNYLGPLGFAGVTRPSGGSPVPQSLLLAAMVRLGCSFGVARRRFRADVAIGEIQRALEQIAVQVAFLGRRLPGHVLEDHAALTRVIRQPTAEPAQPEEGVLTCAP